MESFLTLPYLPDCLFFILAAAIIFEMVRYRRRFDTSVWTEAVAARVKQAENDSDTRDSRLEAIETQLQALPVRPPAPVPMEKDIQFRTYPTIMLLAVIGGVILLYIGMFHSLPKQGVRWHLFAGLALMGVTLVAYWHLWRNRGPFFAVRLLHEKYQMQKVADLPARLDTLRKILAYYPKLPGLWMEYAHEQFVLGDNDGARESLRKIEELLPNSPEPGVLLARFWLRQGEFARAEAALSQAEEHIAGLPDARITLFRAALALERQDRAGADEMLQKARDLDAEMVEAMLLRDETLGKLANYQAGREESAGNQGEEAALA
ncbi:MAG: hypothetical protein LIQ31_07065 [Planctomycetes bacterium]|nr:hypothetical protein [Planctomycetota bacterium]